jgi:hypothetical protein
MNTGVSVLVSAADSVSVPLLLTNEELIREILNKLKIKVINYYTAYSTVQYKSSTYWLFLQSFFLLRQGRLPP